MKVKDVIASALKLLGRADLVPSLPDASYDEEGRELIETLLYCFNAVEDELARKYIPLVTRERLISPNNRYYYNLFNHNPIKIKRVTADGKSVKFEVFTKFIAVQEKDIEVDYEYAPERKNLDGNSDYGDDAGEYLLALGMASEYCVINGEAEMADKWEEKYRARLDAIQRTLPVCGSIPPRSWI